eukprot:SAG11_NODE_1015_length_6172_cov_13.477359_7_plen_92_part_00
MAVDDACCDPLDESDTCDISGVPQSFDFECSMQFLPFQEDCAETIRLLFANEPSAISGLDDLSQTCRRLPIEPMFRAIHNANCVQNHNGGH